MEWKNCLLKVLLALVLLQFGNDILLAEPTTAYQAEKVVVGWLRTDPEPLGMEIGQQVAKIETHTNDNAEPVYYIVYLEPSGFVIVACSPKTDPV